MTNVTALTLFDRAPVPAEITEAFGGLKNNIPERQTIPQLSFRGKAWRVVVGGKENIIYNKEGEPVQTVKVIILDLTARRARSYFEGAYDPDKAQQPVCWSDDGVVPDPTSAKKQSDACATCPQAAKGSKISDAGKPMAACGQFKRAVVVPAQDISFEPLLLKIPQTSLWDKDNEENEAKGFYAFDQYMDFLHRNNVPHSASLVTKIRFDQRTSYPKLVFGAEDWVPVTQRDAVTELVSDPRVGTLLQSPVDAIAERSQMADPEPEAAQETAAPAPAPAPAAAAKPVQAAGAPKVTKGVPPPPARAPRAPKAAAPVAAPAPAGVASADPDDEPVLSGGAPTPKSNGAAAQPAVATVTDAKGIGNLVQSWDDQ